MTVNEELLNKARTAGEALAQAERNVQQTRAEYHGIVRRMHLAGSSLREIAQALGLSHQRVHQMVEGAGGSWWSRLWGPRNLRTNLSCTFCKRPQGRLARLIAGPKVHICDACVDAAEKSLNAERDPMVRPTFARAGESSRARCSFCGKGRSSERPLLTSPAGGICGECLAVCRQILIDCAV
jgi:hypothetical protein